MPRTLQGPTLDLGDTTNRIPDGIHYPHRTQTLTAAIWYY